MKNVHIVIKDIHWTIKFVEKTHEKLEITENEENVCGITHFSIGEIYINKDISQYLIKRTIRHELTHAYIFSYGLGQYEEFSEENVCDLVETYGEDIVDFTNYIYKEYMTELMKGGK